MGITRSQDVLVLLKLVAHCNEAKHFTFAELGKELSLSASQVFRSVRDAEEARLLNPVAVNAPGASAESAEEKRNVRFWPNNRNVKEFLIHAVKYVFPVTHGGPTRGIPTASAAPPLLEHFPQDFALAPVWPYAGGTTRGIEFSPLHKSVPHAALRDPKLYELLALLDAIREGRAREREFAVAELTARIDCR